MMLRLAPLMFLAACAGAEGDSTLPSDTADSSDTTPHIDTLRVESYAATSDDRGKLVVPIEVEEGDVFQVVSQRETIGSCAISLVAPDGTEVYNFYDWYGQPEQLTNAIFTRRTTTFDWPPRTADGPLTPGEWSLTFRTTLDADDDFASVGNADAKVTVMRRKRTDLAHGSLQLRVAYAGGLEEDDEVRRSTEAALLETTAIYASVGIEVGVTFTTIAAEGTIPDSYDDLPGAAELAGATDPRAVLVVVGNEFEKADQLGLTMGVPEVFGQDVGSAGARIGWLVIAGADGEMDDVEARVLGEVIAHEVGHHLGLFHPFEDGYYLRDALADTLICEDESSCAALFESNLMNWYNSCSTGLRNCVAQNRLTTDQFGVMQRYIGVEQGGGS